MKFTETNDVQTVKALFNYKVVHTHILLLCVTLVWCWFAISYGIDDDLLIFLPFIIIPFIVGLLISLFASSKLQLYILPNCILGVHYFNKYFSLPIENIQSVNLYGNNGIKIMCRSGKTYNFSYITNRDDVCTAMANNGIDVDKTLITDVNSIIIGESDVKKHNLFKKLLIIFPWLGNIFLTISAIYYNSYDNVYWHTYTAYYNYEGYKIPYESGYWAHYYDLGEIFTTYLSIACFISVIVLFTLYLIMANNKISVSLSMVRGVNGFGKATIIPMEQITGANISSHNSMISINRMGNSYKYYWLKNNTQLCAAISDIKTGKQPVITEELKANTIFDTTTNNTDNEKSRSISEASEEIKQLKTLFDEGIISEEEFNIKKKQILNL